MGKAVFVYGEVHDKNPETLSYVGASMKMLRTRGVENMALEIPMDRQDDFISAAKAGKESHQFEAPRTAARGMEKIGGAGKWGFPSQHLRLAREAMAIGVKVHCVDLPERELGRELGRTMDAISRAVRGGSGKIGKAADGMDQSGAGGNALERGSRAVGEVLGRRNAHMATEISKMEGDTILLTGISHTGGENGIERHLRAMGMRVVATDIYGARPSPAEEASRKTEDPKVDFQSIGVARPTRKSIEAQISALSSRQDVEAKAARKAPSPLPGPGAVDLRTRGCVRAAAGFAR